jgi:hypothetical protein
MEDKPSGPRLGTPRRVAASAEIVAPDGYANLLRGNADQVLTATAEHLNLDARQAAY